MCGFIYLSKKPKAKKEKEISQKLIHRGPDSFRTREFEDGVFYFHRLAVMGPDPRGDQPMQKDQMLSVCNGEIYNYLELIKKYDLTMSSDSDCETLLPLYQLFGLKRMLKLIDGEFAFAIWDEEKVVAARDPMGIRPLFYAFDEEGKIQLASEMKALLPLFCDIKPFPPGHYWDGEKFEAFHQYEKVKVRKDRTMHEVLNGIHDHLVDGIVKRLQSDTPIGFLLSGGLDSSLVCAVAQRYSDKPIRTFAIGMSEDAIDLKYAKIVADYIGSDHTEVIITREDAIAAISDVIYHLESFDITTVRASVGMYLVCKYIGEKTDIKALMTGEVSDEIFGYKYTDFAPSAAAFQAEAQKRVKELYIYDVLRADRCISAHSLEARVPFSHKSFVDFVMSIDPELKLNKWGKGKYLLRAAFEAGQYLPDEILWREKAAFSDAVGHSLVDCLKEYAQQIYDTDDLEKARFKYQHAPPFTKESLMYRDIFEGHFPMQAKLIKDFWMPNKEWENCDVADPSARVLPNYGASGS